MTAGHAKAIAGMDPSEQIKALKKCIKRGLSVRQMEQMARKLNERAETTLLEDEEYPESYASLIDELERLFSDNISLKRTKSGSCRITIECATDSDIEQLIERLKRLK